MYEKAKVLVLVVICGERSCFFFDLPFLPARACGITAVILRCLLPFVGDVKSQGR